MWTGMKLDVKNPWLFLGVVLGWRLLLLVLTAQPVPAGDAFLFDGPVINWLLHGQYFNPSLAECFPISGRQVFSAYPPVYQGMLLGWMSLFGTSALAAMWFHFVCGCITGVLLVNILRIAFPGNPWTNLAILFLFAVTFDDRPEGLAHVFGMLSLLLVVLQARGALSWAVGQTATALALFCCLYTSIIVGAFYTGVAILSGVAGWVQTRRRLPWAAAAGVILLFGAVTGWIAKAHPLLWSGFLENARQTPVSTAGFRVPEPGEVIKIARNAPVFLLALCCVPWLWKSLSGCLGKAAQKAPATAKSEAWPSLTAGIAIGGWLLLTGALTLLTSNYVVYLWDSQVLLAAGVITLAATVRRRTRRLVHAALLGCLALVSVRAVGMTTWGVLCASDISYRRAQSIVRQELQPFTKVPTPVSVSSAFLYEAASLGVRRAVHSDWAYDRRGHAPGTELWLLNELRPAKLILTQFDYYRIHSPILEDLARHPELGSAKVRNTACLPTPDSFPSLQRVVQQVSWAPVIVEFTWK